MKKHKNILIFIIFTVLYVSAFLFVPKFANEFSDSISNVNLENTGKLGDTFGIFNAFFTSISVVILAISFHYQKKSFDVQGDELKLQREDIKAQSKIFLEQLKQGQINNDISILFAIINKMQTAIGNLRARSNSITIRPRQNDEDPYLYGVDALKMHNKITEKLILPNSDASDSFIEYYRNIYYPILKDLTVAARIADGNDKLQDVLSNSIPHDVKDIFIHLMNSTQDYEGRMNIINNYEKLPKWLTDAI